MPAQRVQARNLRGFRDYLPEDMIPRQRMVAAIADVFERHGFSPLGTPALEYSEVVLGKYGADAEKLLFRFTDNGGRDVCMRYELTASLARVAAQYGQLPKPLKCYQIGPVWRAERPGHGRFREFYQCDADIVGADGPLADYECIQVDYDVLTALGVRRFVIRVGNRRLLDGLAALLGIELKERKHAIGRTIDKLPSQGRETVTRLLAEDAGLTPDEIKRVFGLLDITGTNDEIIAQLRAFFADSAAGLEGTDDLEKAVTYAEAGGIPHEFVQLDTSVVRGLDYYTGTVYETFLLDMPELGSVMSGGRYDRLVSVFTGDDVPAVGISVGIDRLIAGLQEMGRVAAQSCVSEAIVTVFDDQTTVVSLKAASNLRRKGIRTEIAVEGGGLRKQLKYANRLGIPYAVIIGPDEAEAGTMTVRDMNTGEQHTCTSIEEAAIRIRPDA